MTWLQLIGFGLAIIILDVRTLNLKRRVQELETKNDSRSSSQT